MLLGCHASYAWLSAFPNRIGQKVEQPNENQPNLGSDLMNHPVYPNLNLDDESVTTDDSADIAPPRQPPLVARDANVQFFPCKTCGAKFPSYYFVHKVLSTAVDYSTKSNV